MYESDVEKREEFSSEYEDGGQDGEKSCTSKVNSLAVPQSVVGEADREAVDGPDSLARSAGIVLHGEVDNGLTGGSVEAVRDEDPVQVRSSA